MLRSIVTALSVSFAFLAASVVIPSRIAGQSTSHRDPPRVAIATTKAPQRQTGIASFYANSLQGKKTANGTRFDKRKLTAASLTLPLNSKAKVTNLQTGRTVNVTITDRGPYVNHRVIDLSPAAAKHIGLTKKEGLAPVQVESSAPQPNRG